MSKDSYIENCKACLATHTVTSEQAESTLKQYGQTITSIGYVGFLALWSQLWGKVDDGWLLVSGALILISGSLFVGLEVFMLRFNAKGQAQRKVLLTQLAQALQEENKVEIALTIKKLYPEQADNEESKVDVYLANISILSGFSAAIVLIVGIVSFFISGL